MLCRKTVDLFTLLSHTQETGARRIGMTQELLALVTGLAHYLKILIRIDLTGALETVNGHLLYIPAGFLAAEEQLRNDRLLSRITALLTLFDNGELVRINGDDPDRHDIRTAFRQQRSKTGYRQPRAAQRKRRAADRRVIPRPAVPCAAGSGQSGLGR